MTALELFCGIGGFAAATYLRGIFDPRFALKLARKAASAKPRPRKPAPRPFEWRSKPMGALVDLEDKDVVYAILDRADRAAEP